MPEERDRDSTGAAVAAVALNLPVQRTFDYLIPQRLRGEVVVGGRVRVPFGSRPSVPGYCVELKSESSLPEVELKEVLGGQGRGPVFDLRMLELARWIARYYGCSLGEALHAAMPAAIRTGRGRRHVWFASLCPAAPEAERRAEELFKRSPAQSKIMRALAAVDGEATVADLKRATSTTLSSFRALARRGLIRMEKRTMEDEDALAGVRSEPVEPPVLTREQQHARRLIRERMRPGRFDVVLLHGITSSGKTEVYLQCIAELVAQGGRAIVLVPEISLTPQTIRHFAGRFRRLAVLHSKLTGSQRRAQWKLVQQDRADVVIGARSAIFAPVRSLGLVVIDEEHENSFKQDHVPRYHARDVGIMRAKLEGALVVLGSATPSLESYHNGRVGKYTVVHLTRRIGGHPLPPVEVVDMRHEWAGHSRVRVISRRLEECMRASLNRGEQVILFINRKGYAPFVHCPRCGYVLKCPRCDITLNFRRKANVVACHYCGHERRPPGACPECGLKDIRYSGMGTERVEHATRDLFPDASIIRMDSDTTVARRAHEQKLEAFRTGSARVLIGTQMVAKGLDFPLVTTVGVVNADVSLHLPDFRSRERTFQLLAQVAGRTGRGPAGGRVVVQTFMPEDPSILAGARHDYEGFASTELPHRRQLGYPPYGRLVRVICRARRADRARDCIGGLAAALRKLCDEQADGSLVLGPAPAPVAQIRGLHRYHLLVKCPGARAVREIIERSRGLMKGPSGVKVIVDVDPISML